MKQLNKSELEKAAKILQTLDYDALTIIQYLASLGPYGTDSELSIVRAKFLRFNFIEEVRLSIDALAEIGIVNIIDAASFTDPEARLVQMKELSEMPTLAQAIILELWPDWSGLPEVKPEPLLNMGHVNWQPVIDVSARPLSEQLVMGYARTEEECNAVERASRLGYTTMRLSVTLSGNGSTQSQKIQVRKGFNIDSVSETWIDLEDPEAVWNSTQQVE